MSWFLLSFIPPFLWGVNTVVDQYLARRYFAGQPAALQAFQGTLTCLAAILIFIVFPMSDWVWGAIVMAMLAGALLNLSYVPYVKALQGDDVTLVVALFQLLPVFVFAGEWLFLEGGADLRQFGAASIVIAASLSLVWDFKIRRLKWQPLLLMGLSCIGIAGVVLISKAIAGQIHWIHIAAWMGIGAGVSSSCMFLQDKQRAKAVVHSIQEKPALVISLSIIQEAVSRGAMILNHYILLIASSAALVQTAISGAQPLYVLILGGIAWLLAKDVYDKPDWKGHTFQKLVCILIMIGGLALLYGLV